MEDQKQAIKQLLNPFRLALSYNYLMDEKEPLKQHGVAPISTIKEAKSHMDIWTANVDERLRERVSRKILRYLWFPTIALRENQIHEAYANTYQWIFDNPGAESQPWDSFVEWLENGSGIYWVNGKAASGKSTLMRYISHHPQMHTHLKEWVGQSGLHIGRFYFWNSGIPEQRSQAGLLRTLLFDHLLQDPDLIPVAFPRLWTKLYSDEVRNFYLENSDGMSRSAHTQTWNESLRSDQNWVDQPGSIKDWSLNSLMDALTLLIEQCSTRSNICLYVDGLDEYEGDHMVIATLFKRIVVSSNVKVCVSSRPLLTFSDSFKDSPSLRLQDLTEKDITYYID
jgi:hypothetical protein